MREREREREVLTSDWTGVALMEFELNFLYED